MKDTKDSWITGFIIGAIITLVAGMSILISVLR